jgi:hypothetical protein
MSLGPRMRCSASTHKSITRPASFREQRPRDEALGQWVNEVSMAGILLDTPHTVSQVLEVA